MCLYNIFMSKLKIDLLLREEPGANEEIGLNERKASKTQYHIDEKLLQVFLGKKKDLSIKKIREILSKADWKNISETEVEININDLDAESVEAAYEIIVLKSFIFDKYKSDAGARQVQVKKVSFKPSKPKDFDYEYRSKVIDAIKFCRDIVSSNASTINPGQMQKFAENLAKEHPVITVKSIDAQEAKKLNMECLLAVGAESLKNSSPSFHPRIVELSFQGAKYKNSKKDKHIALVGKGITYDTGGLCLKPTQYMLDMKSDMTGAATVLSVFSALPNIAKYLPDNIKITGIMALSENAFGASSYKPGDVLRAMNGTTVEVVDTDAEGRLVLADALSYMSALKDQPNYCIDLATLTGSIVASLGEIAAGAMTNNDEFKDQVINAFRKEGENLWHMPLFSEYKTLLDSSIADIKHCNTRPDALCAGIFLKEFVHKNIKWLHLDIAGVGFIEEDGLWAYKGATGFGIKGLLKLLKDLGVPPNP
jgi:leucyl aminopeptidase